VLASAGRWLAVVRGCVILIQLLQLLLLLLVGVQRGSFQQRLFVLLGTRVDGGKGGEVSTSRAELLLSQ
jgi:hypothetical protein